MIWDGGGVSSFSWDQLSGPSGWAGLGSSWLGSLLRLLSFDRIPRTGWLIWSHLGWLELLGPSVWSLSLQQTSWAVYRVVTGLQRQQESQCQCASTPQVSVGIMLPSALLAKASHMAKP